MPCSPVGGMAYAGRRNGLGRNAECEVAVPGRPARLRGYVCGIETAKYLRYSTFRLVTTRSSQNSSLLYPASLNLNSHEIVSLVGQFPYHNIRSPISAAAMLWLRAKVHSAGLGRTTAACRREVDKLISRPAFVPIPISLGSVRHCRSGHVQGVV